ncbi:MAG: hypothetical protein JST33_15395 [Actinobacteria bacterium]|nr:hypothetical protein [Actinomycetota bacterium]
MQITKHGDRTDVVLAPIAITDLIRNGELSFDQELKPGELLVQGYDGGGVHDVTSDGSDGIEPTSFDRPGSGILDGSGIRPTAAIHPAVAIHPADDPNDPLADKPLPVPAKEFSKKTDDWTLSGGTGRDGLHFAIETESHGLKVNGSGTLLFDALHVNLGAAIANSVMGGTRGRISGIQGVKVDLQAGSQNQGGDTLKKEFKLPFEIPVQTVIGGVPLFMKLSTSATVSAALVGTDATITGAGEWRLGTPLDMTIDGETVSADTGQDLQIVHSIMDSISGIALGGAVLNLGFKMKMLMGVGAPYFGAGAFGTVTIMIGIGIGSALGSPLALCRSASYDLAVGKGIGVVSEYSIVTSLLEKIPHVKDVLPDDGLTRQTSRSVLHRKQVLPDVPVCNGGS